MGTKGKILISVCVLIWSTFNVTSQTNNDILDQLTEDFSDQMDSKSTSEQSILDDILNVKPTLHFLYSGITLSSSTPYSGRDYYTGAGSTLPQIFYINTKGWMFGLGVAKYDALFPVSTSFVFSGGYSFSVDKKDNIRTRLGYSRGTSQSNLDNETSTSNTFSSSLNFNMDKLISSRISYSYLVSLENSHQFSVDLFKKVNIKKWKNGNSLSVTPNLNFYFSDNEYPADLYTTTRANNQTSYEYQYASSFGLLNTALTVPLEINIGDFDFSIEYTHNMPHKFSEYEDFDVSHTLSFSIGYFLFLR